MLTVFEQGYALLVGVGECDYPEWSLPVTALDAMAIARILKDPDLCAYRDTHVRLLHDSEAIGSGILDGLAWLRDQSVGDPEATVIVYYSGHGWLDASTSRYYLVPHDVEPSDVTRSALSATVFAEEIRKIQAKRLLVFIDSCHAEGMASAKDESPVKLPPDLVESVAPKGLVDQLKEGQGRAVFTSSRGTQRSWVRPDGSLSVYTYHLTEALQGAGNQSGDTTVRLSNLMNHLGRTVPQSARSLCNVEQTPFFDTAAEDYPVAMLRGGKGLPEGGWQAAQAERNHQGTRVVQAIGPRSVAIGGSAQNNVIITGDSNLVDRG